LDVLQDAHTGVSVSSHNTFNCHAFSNHVQEQKAGFYQF